MNHNKSIWYLIGLIMLAVLVAIALAPQVARANDRYEDGGDLPLYARLERGQTFTDNEWVVVVFYRPTECIPEEFNLLDFFDFENAWSCTPPTTDGFGIVKDGTAPIQQELHGEGAVPVWFVKLADYEGAIADDVLTIVELRGLPSLKEGSASFYHETLHPYGVAIKNSLEYNAHGRLDDGTSFRVHFVGTEAHFKVDVQIGD